MTNVTHKFLSMYLFLFLTLYMFRAHRAHHQERKIVSIQPLGNCHSVLVAVLFAGWSFTKNHYMMHGQQNIKFFSVFLTEYIYTFCSIFLEFTATLSLTILIYVWYGAAVILLNINITSKYFF